MVLLLAISFVLHFVAFFFMVILYQKVYAKEDTLQNMKKEKQEIEDLLIAYMEEMKEENRQLKEWIHQEHLVKNEIKEQSKESKKETKEDQTIKKQMVLPVDNVQDIYDFSPSMQAITLANQGLSIEEIAKKMKKGKGEVELLLKFNPSTKKNNTK
ncbi:DUF6115 domain-containing protein [Massilibacterium senegalense]|uniref:DUF6115 domain-containing protein n=1 Tax=Massilibacterium senegalense TaxID=1632858 RepID=UPI000780DE17|nr:hypothetical protein [Massilibacterium senegalense]